MAVFLQIIQYILIVKRKYTVCSIENFFKLAVMVSGMELRQPPL